MGGMARINRALQPTGEACLRSKGNVAAIPAEAVTSARACSIGQPGHVDVNKIFDTSYRTAELAAKAFPR
jgi:hypothetical protein